MSKNKYIEVKSGITAGVDGGNEVAHYEKNAGHPDGEVFVSSPEKWVKVAPTAQVREKITKGILIEKSGGDDDGKQDSEPALELQTGDTAETLTDRYNRKQLLQMAEENSVKLPNGNAKNIEIAEAILDGAAE